MCSNLKGMEERKEKIMDVAEEEKMWNNNTSSCNRYTKESKLLL